MDKFYKIKASANPLEAARKALALTCNIKMNNCIKSCNVCKTCNNSKTVGEGNVDANILIISDFPTNNARDKILLDNIITNSKINIHDIYKINAVNCQCIRTNGKERLPSLEELKNCKVYSNYAIDFVKPRIIILMGSTALNQYAFDNVNLLENANKTTYIKGIKTFVTYSVRDIRNLENIDEIKADEAYIEIIDTLNKAQEIINRGREE